MTYSWPSGKRLATWRPKRMASAVLPTPAVPEMTATGTDSSVPAARADGSMACSARSSSWRPEKPGASSGSCAGTGTPVDPAAHGGARSGAVVPLGRTDPSDPRGPVPASFRRDPGDPAGPPARPSAAGPAGPPSAAVLAAAVLARPPAAAVLAGPLAAAVLAWPLAAAGLAWFSAGSEVSTCW